MKKHLVARVLALAGTMGFALALLPGVASAATTIGNDVSVGGGLTATASSTFIAGLQVSGAFNASSTLNVGGAAVFGSTVVVTGLVTHNGGYIGTASSTFSAGLQVAGAFNASSTLNVSGAARFASLSTFVSGFVSNASSSVGAGLQVAGNLSVSSTLTLGGNVLPNGNNTLSIGAFGSAFANIYTSGTVFAPSSTISNKVSGTTTTLFLDGNTSGNGGGTQIVLRAPNSTTCYALYIGELPGIAGAGFGVMGVTTTRLSSCY